MARARCPSCGVPISSNDECINASCSTTTVGASLGFGHNRFGDGIEPKAEVRESSFHRRIPDDTDMPGKKSLLALLGYSVGKASTEGDRRGALEAAVLSDLVAGKGAPCEPWISRYGPPNSPERKKMVLMRLEELLGGMWWVKKYNGERASATKKWPEYQKRESDIKWFKVHFPEVRK